MRNLMIAMTAVVGLTVAPAVSAAPLACPASAAHYHLSGNAAVTATLGKRPARGDDASDLYLRIADGRDLLWFALDFGSAKGVTALRSSRSALDRPLPAGEKPDYVVRDVSAHFFDARFRTTGDDLTSRRAAPAYLFISDLDWPRNPGEAPERRPFPRKLGSALFVLDRCTR